MRPRPEPALLIVVAYVAVLVGGIALSAATGDGDLVVDALFLGMLFVPYVSVGALIVWRRGGNAVGWLLAASGTGAVLSFFLDAYTVYGVVTAPGALPFVGVTAWVSFWMWMAVLAPLLFTVLLFPTGRPASPRWRPVLWCAGLVLGAVTLVFAFGPDSHERYPQIVNPLGVAALRPALEFVNATFLIFAGLFAIAVVSVIARFRAARGVERQQLKWAASGFAFSAIALGLSNITLLTDLGWILGVGVIPVAIGIAILRYRLYDIDLLINRTLVYGALSALLAATYFGAAVVLSALLRPFAAESELAVAGSTLAVVVLFAPLRSRIQRLVDERFYRSKYDAARTLDTFAARLRDQVDLDALEREVLGVVGQTVQPAHAALWLRERAR